MLETAGEAELPLPIELGMLLGLLVVAPNGVVELLLEGKPVLPLAGVMAPLLLLGIVMSVPAPLLALLPRGTKVGLDPDEAGVLIVLPAISSRGAGTLVLWFCVRWPRRPMPRSAFPPAYFGPFLSGLAHPLNKIPRPHAPIRPTKGIRAIVLSSPV